MKSLAVGFALLLAVLVAGYLVFFAMLAARSRRAPRLEVRDGRLKACARPSNCVNTQDAGGGVAPLRFSGSPAAAWLRLRASVTGLPRTTVLTEADGYLRAEVATSIFGFRDDIEALLDAESGLIHLRSASRVGLRDRGVNGRRVEKVRRRFEDAAGAGS